MSQDNFYFHLQCHFGFTVQPLQNMAPLALERGTDLILVGFPTKIPCFYEVCKKLKIQDMPMKLFQSLVMPSVASLTALQSVWSLSLMFALGS